jgi:hypothetical protein
MPRRIPHVGGGSDRLGCLNESGLTIKAIMAPWGRVGRCPNKGGFRHTWTPEHGWHSHEFLGEFYIRYDDEMANASADRQTEQRWLGGVVSVSMGRRALFLSRCSFSK